MNNKVESQQVVEIIKEHKVRPNKDLILAMEFIKKDFDITKENLMYIKWVKCQSQLVWNLLAKCFFVHTSLNSMQQTIISSVPTQALPIR